MAGHPLRSATDRRLGGLLSHQLANQTRVHLIPPEFFTPCHATLCAYAVLPAVSSCYPPVQGRLPTRYSPVRHSVIKNFKPKKSVANASFDLHVLSTPPAFILSQDQTLMKKVCLVSYKLTSLNSFTKTYCLGLCIFRYSQDSLMNHFKILKEFQGCLSIQLSKICIAQTQYLSGVLSLICYRLPRRLVYNIIRYTHCQQLFSKSFKKVQFFSIIDF